ncbi:hypothetical protein, variant [Aphanomyces invadans]|uniref:SGNH hydrolase-type esterase domain-containing protein n=1 Tax=Aphanomyces invadans TaxID=157072 RepID=A0A024TRS6_9STRA|nr:hypothetical protein, variant [Aphanomyces invadans]ETV96037.1 hypothetical protein, variant [Aphanomyces invadans]|eukprot:XP_008875348.1 hypothetical protein, variant [Aphanomyces invadans]
MIHVSIITLWISLVSISCVWGLTPVVVTLGDSLTEYGGDAGDSGWVWMLSQDYRDKARVVNWGHAGWNTQQWVPEVSFVIDSFRGKEPPVLFTLFLGANDCALDQYTPPHVPLAQYQTNLESIVLALQSAFPASAILLITPPSVDDILLAQYRSNARTGAYAAACIALGKQMNIPVVDLWTPTRHRVTTLLKDGIHFNREGNIVVHEIITAAIEDNFPMLMPWTISHLGVPF